MIHDVDETIREIVRRHVLNGSGIDVSFEAPTSEWAAKQSGPALNFYLYDIREDLNRRLVEFVETRNSEGFVTDRRQPPRRYKLSYLATAWTQRPEDEHRLLSAVLAAFIQSDILPFDVLQGSLADADDPVKVTIALPPPQDRSLSDVWSALGGELKPSLDLVVTAPFDPVRTLQIGPPVLEEPRLRFEDDDGRREEVARAGRRPPRAAADREPIAAEEVQAGATESGRHVHSKWLPRQ
ncbi:MAG TPA: DUF4255 domain-containing protein [Euzebyales bacterium]|nr:DUF4255 domain-containing protein [Euzebyales bacterium]